MKNPDTSIQGKKDTIEQQPLPLSVTLHLLPGLLILLFYVATVPLVTEWGFPASFATLLGFLFIGIPFELGFLYYSFWQPANIPEIFLLVTPLYYLVWWKRNIYISIAVHCTANLIGVIVAFTSS